MRVVRPASPADLPKLRELEREANMPFLSLGMTAVAYLEPTSLADLSDFQRGGRALVVADEADDPVAFLLMRVIDGNAHIDQVSVHPGYARQGIGSRLLDAASSWARNHHLHALTLTTYAAVPWNAPYYVRLGFRVLDENDLPSGLRDIRDRNAGSPLAQWPRVSMARTVSGAS
jgi:GNAT superfamily N-acetyltransferase